MADRRSPALREFHGRLQKGIEQLLDASRGGVTAEELGWVLEFLDHFELGLAAESLLEYVEDQTLAARNPDLGPLVTNVEALLVEAKSFSK